MTHTWNDELEVEINDMDKKARYQAWGWIQQNVEVKRFKRNGRVILRLVHSSGLSVEQTVGASKQRSYRTAFNELLKLLDKGEVG